jgi:hypothetical protein
MKNIHILPTDKPSRLYLGNNGNFVFGMVQTSIQSKNDDFTNQNIYITSNEEIKEGDWYFFNVGYAIGAKKADEHDINQIHLEFDTKKIILTTHQDLVKDGVQPIDDEFLEWFVKNPSCEFAELQEVKCKGQCWKFIESDYEDTCTNGCEQIEYKIIISKEEPKQETLEEFINEELEDVFFTNISKRKEAERLIEIGAKWQQEKSYSEEDLKDIVTIAQSTKNYGDYKPFTFSEIMEQFKKK